MGVIVSDDLHVDPALLAQAAAGINGIIDVLTDLGITETAAAGRGFSAISMSTVAAGHVSVQKQLEEFAERWTWGVRTLVQNANAIAETLDLAAGRYYLMDRAVDDMLKEATAHIVSNPHLTSDEIAARSWDETWADNLLTNTLSADYSAASAQEATDRIGSNLETIGNNADEVVDTVTTVIP